MSDIVFGLDTFGDVPADDSGATVTHARSIRQLVEEATLADELGVDVFTVGEHHRPEYSVSSPETVLAGLATETKRIRLGLKDRPVTWSGTTRAALVDADVFPKTEHGVSTWVGVGGSPQSVVRSAEYGFPLMLAIIGGQSERFLPYVDLYRRATEQFGTTTHPVGVHSPGFVADTDEEALAAWYAPYKVVHDRIGSLRGWPPVKRGDFDHEVRSGSMYVGSAETVAQKMARTIHAMGVGRFDLIYSAGAQTMSSRLRSVELYGKVVIPRVRELLSQMPSALTVNA